MGCYFASERTDRKDTSPQTLKLANKIHDQFSGAFLVVVRGVHARVHARTSCQLHSRRAVRCVPLGAFNHRAAGAV